MYDMAFPYCIYCKLLCKRGRIQFMLNERLPPTEKKVKVTNMKLPRLMWAGTGSGGAGAGGSGVGECCHGFFL